MPDHPQTLEDLYCAAHQATPEQFRKHAFWRCLHWPAIPLAPLILVFNRRYFKPDRDMIAAIGKATSMAHVWDEIRHLFSDPNNRHWLRQRANVRVSGHKVVKFARSYLPPMSKPLVTARS